MELSTWNETNQHWFCQFLLRGFKAKGKSSLIYELDTTSGEIEPRKVDEVASKSQLLTDGEDELMRGIEKRSSKVVSKIRKGILDVGADERLILDNLVWTLWFNNPFSSLDKKGDHDDAIKHTVDRFVSAVRRHGGTVDPDDVTRMARQALNRDYLCHAFRFSPQGPARILNWMRLTLYEPPPGEFFVVGDSPVAIARATRDGMTNLWNDGSQLMLPVGSRHLLAYDWGDSPTPIRHGGNVNVSQLEAVDEYYRYGQRCRHIYGRTPDALRRTCKLKMQWHTTGSASRANQTRPMPRLLQHVLEQDWETREAASTSRLDDTARLMVSLAAQQDPH